MEDDEFTTAAVAAIDGAGELAPLNIIRTETVFSRLPVHNLTKSGRVDIQIVRKNETGEVDLKWEVSYSDRYGQAGQLAYKVETLIVNRRIEEERRPLPRAVRLGSLAQLCRELGMPASGKNVNDLRRAIHQNAGTYITAKLKYRAADGSERRIEAGFTRYSIVFTGETLPDGAVADGVYIILNDPYRDVLNTAPVRPLNYDYLRELRPTPQRFYEIMSYRFFAAFKNGRLSARITYSDYCVYSAQQRQYDAERFRLQMYKLHKPHLESGYLKSVSFEAIQDGEGKPDWLMIYTPGPRARNEYQTFARRQAPLFVEPAVADAATLRELTSRGVVEAKAKQLLQQLQPNQHVLDQLEWADAIIAQAGAGTFRNPPGFYVSLVRDNITPPASFETSRRRRHRDAADRAAQDRRLASHQDEFAYDDYRRAAVDRAIGALERETLAAAVAAKRSHYHRIHPALPADTLSEIALAGVRNDIEQELKLLSFEEFRTQGT
jgi:hypothetical protein